MHLITSRLTFLPALYDKPMRRVTVHGGGSWRGREHLFHLTLFRWAGV
jgi:hypothetical protein